MIYHDEVDLLEMEFYQKDDDDNWILVKGLVGGESLRALISLNDQISHCRDAKTQLCMASGGGHWVKQSYEECSKMFKQIRMNLKKLDRERMTMPNNPVMDILKQIAANTGAK